MYQWGMANRHTVEFKSRPPIGTKIFPSDEKVGEREQSELKEIETAIVFETLINKSQ